MKVLVVAGGTGGHFYPGLAVAKELVKDGAKVHFLVRDNDAVIPLVKKDGFSYSTIQAAGFKRRFSVQNFITTGKLLFGTAQTMAVFLRVRPNVVLAMGGYLSLPPAVVAKTLRIPIVLHEQNVKPGLANRLIAKWANAVAVAFPESRGYFSGNVSVTGNPVRAEFLSPVNRDVALRQFSLDPAKKTLLVFGGSLGARRLNDLVVKALSAMPELAGTWQVLHISGPKEEEHVRGAYRDSKFKVHVAGYCHDMAAAYAAADFVVCRAGAITVSELAVLKKPALLVPYPFASENHQWANALVLKEKGAAQVHEEAELAGGKMLPVLGALLRDEKGRKRMAEWNGEVSHARAAAEIKNAVYGVVKAPISPK